MLLRMCASHPALAVRPCTPLPMARPAQHRGLLFVLLAVAVAASAEASSGGGLGFDLHHRFSPVVRRWAEARGHAAWWPDAGEGSPEYYSALSRHDRARRGLAVDGEGKGLIAFADGNDTYRLDRTGSLHYAEVAVGTPNATFLVALDTGSDLFWVPCDCKSCAPIGNNATDVQGGPELRPYSPQNSSTSKPVTCGSALCDRPNACGGNRSSCPYTVRYVSANTSSSGVLVEDVLHLTREGQRGSGGEAAIKAPVVFGCGQEQTGVFLRGAAADGLLGLGMDRVSVPSVLASSGLVASDSFSMCFSPDGVGRINFGDAGRRGAQAETPFIVSNTRPTYNISVTAINVDGKAVPSEFAAAVDSGTSFTYLSDPAYTELTTNINSQIRERRANLSASIPFEYCYRLGRNQTDVSLPELSLTTKGGAVFPVTRPFVFLAGETSDGQVHVVGYCLAVLRNDITTVDIIGQNFMTGLKVLFDRQRSVLGWRKIDCYKDVETEEAAAPGPAALKPPRQKDGGSSSYPGAVPVPVPWTTSSGSRALVGGLSSVMLLPHLLAGVL